MSRGVFLLGLGVALVALGLALTDGALCLQPGATERNTLRIRKGMTLREVELILAGPPNSRYDIPGKHPGWGVIICLWVGRAGGVAVWLDEHERVTDARWLRDRSAPGLLDRIRAWLGS